MCRLHVFILRTRVGETGESELIFGHFCGVFCDWLDGSVYVAMESESFSIIFRTKSQRKRCIKKINQCPPTTYNRHSTTFSQLTTKKKKNNNKHKIQTKVKKKSSLMALHMAHPNSISVYARITYRYNVQNITRNAN